MPQASTPRERPLPEWLATWAADVALPPSKASFTSEWD